MTIEDLPPEMIWLIMGNLEGNDYRNALLASKRFHVDTKRHRSKILTYEPVNVVRKQRGRQYCLTFITKGMNFKFSHYRGARGQNRNTEMYEFIESVVSNSDLCTFDKRTKSIVMSEEISSKAFTLLYLHLTSSINTCHGIRSCTYVQGQNIEFRMLRKTIKHLKKYLPPTLKGVKSRTKTLFKDLERQKALNYTLYNVRDIQLLLKLFTQLKPHLWKIHEDGMLVYRKPQYHPRELFRDLITSIKAQDCYDLLDVDWIALKNLAREIDDDIIIMCTNTLFRLMGEGRMLTPEMITIAMHSRVVLKDLEYPDTPTMMQQLDPTRTPTTILDDYLLFMNRTNKAIVSVKDVPWLNYDRILDILNTGWAMVSNLPAPALAGSNHYYIGGGSVLWATLVSMGRTDLEGWEDSDWDLFLTGTRAELYHQDAHKLLKVHNASPYSVRIHNNIREVLHHECVPDFEGVVDADTRADLLQHIKCSGKTVTSNGVTYPHRHLQLIGMYSGMNGVELIEQYDLTAVQMYWDGKEVYATIPALYALLHGVCYHYVDAKETRVKKYAARGFQMVPLPFEKDNVCPTNWGAYGYTKRGLSKDNKRVWKWRLATLEDHVAIVEEGKEEDSDTDDVDPFLGLNDIPLDDSDDL